jgi:ATP-dependent exoDNAse (exonuclease V) beta subunit
MATKPERVVPDLAERLRALDPARSFIVQAPAGSGKTELLIQRFLVLLSHVESPEEVIAVTFTRKAAAEMRRRVLLAFGKAKAGEDADTDHEARTLHLASAAVARDALLGWGIADNPSRLRIQTIDSLAASLTRQMPVLARLGAQPAIEELPDALYAEAARATIALVEDDGKAGEDTALMLGHLDNDVSRTESMLAEMLRRRDHWMRPLHGLDRAMLEGAMRRTRSEAMARARGLFPAGADAELAALARYAADNLAAAATPSPLSQIQGGSLPGAAQEDEAAWRGIADLLLTGKDEWRKSVTVNDGFPAGESAAGKRECKPWKERMANLHEALAGQDELRAALASLRQLPPPAYSEAQWLALEAFTRVLPRAVAELKLVFAARGAVDFPEVTQAAIAALGAADRPTDLALALDYRIRHLLVDEFQDTSITQFTLVERLTEGWEPGDGRTLFVVGDPMQSIYRFREAEVGQFLKAWNEGLGSVALEPLVLNANFRSRKGVVDWVNDKFPHVLGNRADPGSGAVPYSASLAMREALGGEAVTVHPFYDGDRLAEAQCVVGIINEAHRHDARARVAILVRNRGHLLAIVPALKAAKLPFKAIDIDPLGSRPVVQDLLSLTRALEHPADRSAWLAVLRAPWCGLSLADLDVLAGVDPESDEGYRQLPTIVELLADEARIARMAAEGRRRAQKTRDILGKALDARLRLSLRERVEGAWLALGGPACVVDPTDLEDAEVFLDLVSARELAGRIADPGAFEEALGKLYALPDRAAGDGLQIMTIHKAKGLEFDHVIVPGLDRPGGNDAKPLVRWMERPVPGEGEESEILIAPVAEAGAEANPIFKWIEKLDRERARHEDARLLYVAATRARERLHLLAAVNVTRKKEARLSKPSDRVLLARLWPIVEDDFQADLPQDAPPEGGGDRPALPQEITRLAAAWRLPAPPPPVPWRLPPEREAFKVPVEYSWAGANARRVGTVVHRWLQRIAEDALEGWDAKRIAGLRPSYGRSLEALGLSGADLEAATARVAEALDGAVTDGKGRWVLGPQYEARNEYRVTVRNAEGIEHLTVDRTFVDGNRRLWIVDYKTGAHEGGDRDAFLDSERERHAPQLRRYATALGGEAALGLYFPLMKAWRDV